MLWPTQHGMHLEQLCVVQKEILTKHKISNLGNDDIKYIISKSCEAR
jgi:hypothetical protein